VKRDAAARLAISCGDPAGIGPEVVLAALRSRAAAGEPIAALVFGPAALPERNALAALPGVRFVALEAAFDFEGPPGVPSAASGRSAAAALFAAIDAALRGEAAAVVTAPLSKEALALAGHAFAGQTEILVERTGSPRAVMLFVARDPGAATTLRIALATRHVALREVPDRVEPQGIAADLVILDAALRRDFGLVRPRIAVCGLNPHAGEHGLFGDEEERRIVPGLAIARAAGVDCVGPLPADTLFVKLRQGAYAAALAMYHDQGLVPIKLVSFGGGVNVSLGLPFPRTSPDHGTAYDIAGRGIADAASMGQAVELALAMTAARAAGALI
jgi:4-hydroxythreonine-4-phosphate dehydrogenase